MWSRTWRAFPPPKLSQEAKNLLRNSETKPVFWPDETGTTLSSCEFVGQKRCWLVKHGRNDNCNLCTTSFTKQGNTERHLFIRERGSCDERTKRVKKRRLKRMIYSTWVACYRWCWIWTWSSRFFTLKQDECAQSDFLVPVFSSSGFMQLLGRKTWLPDHQTLSPSTLHLVKCSHSAVNTNIHTWLLFSLFLGTVWL